MAATIDCLSRKSHGALAAPVVGTMNFGKRTPEPEAARIVARALERGVRWFDTANAYGEGESEKILGRALKGRRAEAFIASKCGIGKMGGPMEGLAPTVVRAALDATLRRLEIEQLDLYYLHTPDQKTPIADTIAVLDEAIRAGKIAAWAVSNHAAWRIGEIMHLCAERGWTRPRASQVLYNLLVRQLDIEYFAYARYADLHTTIYNPLAGGLLAGKGMGRVEPGSRFDKNVRYQKRYLTDRMQELSQAYAQLAQEAGIDRVALAYGFAAQQPGVDSILLGPADVAQLDAGVDGCTQRLDASVLKKIDEIYRDYLGTDASYAR